MIEGIKRLGLWHVQKSFQIYFSFNVILKAESFTWKMVFLLSNAKIHKRESGWIFDTMVDTIILIFYILIKLCHLLLAIYSLQNFINSRDTAFSMSSKSCAIVQ